MVAESVDVVVGVDTHRDSHAFALVRVRDGVVVAETVLPANRGGYREALRLAKRTGGRRLWAVEGSGSYGKGLARSLAAAGERLVEVERPGRQGRRRGKSDALDALAAARAALAERALAAPRSGGSREALRALLVAREGAVATRSAGLNQLRALVVAAPDRLRERLHGLPKARLVRLCLQLRPRRDDQQPERYGTLLALRCCARRVEQATREANELEQELKRLVAAQAPQLLALHGVGPISAAQLLVSWSHPGRIKSEAAFARLAGAAPIPASSGKLIRHRLDRGGDRKLNRALHTIILSRRRRHEPTRAYINRRTSEGKSDRDATRCLKRYLARHLYRLLEATPTTP